MESLWSPAPTPWPSIVPFPWAPEGSIVIGNSPGSDHSSDPGFGASWEKFFSVYGLGEIGTPPTVPEEQISGITQWLDATEIVLGKWIPGFNIGNKIGSFFSGRETAAQRVGIEETGLFPGFFERMGLGVLGIAVVIIALVMLTRPAVQRIINQVT